MALNKRALVLSSSVPYAADQPPCNFYRYATTDAVATVETASYFDGVSDKLKAGDIIEAQMVMGGTTNRKVYKVSSVSAAGVVVIAVDTDAS